MPRLTLLRSLCLPGKSPSSFYNVYCADQTSPLPHTSLTTRSWQNPLPLAQSPGQATARPYALPVRAGAEVARLLPSCCCCIPKNPGIPNKLAAIKESDLSVLNCTWQLLLTPNLSKKTQLTFSTDLRDNANFRGRPKCRTGPPPRASPRALRATPLPPQRPKRMAQLSRPRGMQFGRPDGPSLAS